MPNRISIHHQHQRSGNQSNGDAKVKHISDVATTTTTRYTKIKVSQPTPQPSTITQQQQPTNVLNVAEMLLHGVADHEILDIWLRSISCQEFTTNFQRAGYDMPTISRITPQDLTAIGITDPAKRLKILSEIKKLNLQDGIPNFRPSSLSHWLSLLRLDNHYFESLCDQQIDTIDKMCQLTWEDFEELGITKLGHQKRLLLAIERMKELDATEVKATSRTISEPIYDTNPSQILLVASAENHSMNGPIINKQSSTSELSSTGSGSMHSVYSANSFHYQPNYATLPSISQQPDQNQPCQQAPQQQNQAIYSQLPQSLYQSRLPIMAPPIYDTNTIYGRHTNIPPITTGQLPFSALANLPEHQIQQLQQSSIYATLSRQPQRAKQPPPPVPIRTNSLTSNSLTMGPPQVNSTGTLIRSGTRVSNRAQFNSTLLSKNKSFSGNAYMEAARARFLDRNSQSNASNIQSSDMGMGAHQYQPNRPGITQSGLPGGNDFDTHSDTNSIESLTLQTSICVNSPLAGERQTSSSQDSGSSQTLYNSASSGSNDQSLHGLVSQHSATSSATLNDVNLILENQHLNRFRQGCNIATPGEDADFPPPPSPLSLTDSDEHDLLSLNAEKNFAGMSKGLTAFKIGI